MHSVVESTGLVSESGEGVRSLLTCSFILGGSLNVGLGFSVHKWTGWVRTSLWFLPPPEGGEHSLLKAAVGVPEREGAGEWLRAAHRELLVEDALQTSEQSEGTLDEGSVPGSELKLFLIQSTRFC